MMHTPSGCTAFDNKIFSPKKDDGTRVNGHYNTYRTGKPYVQNGEVLYSDPRCLTLYELFIVFSLPKDWNVPDWADERFIRRVVGEGIPPMLIKNIVEELVNHI